MAQRFTGAINFPTNFDVRDTSPLDVRLVVENKESLIDGSIKYPYQGMAVNIAGTSELWILTTQGIEASKNPENWKLVTGSNGDIDADAVRRLIELIGDPGDSDEPTGIFETLDYILKTSSMGAYQVPIMTPAQRIAALSDPNSGFTEDTDFISLDDGDSDYEHLFDGDRAKFIASIDSNYSSLTGSTANKTISSVNGTYLDIMMSAIKQMQAEITELKSVLAGGIHSYINKNTAKSAVLNDYDKLPTDEPLWSLSAEDGGLTEVPSDGEFRYDLDTLQNVFECPGYVDEINVKKDNVFEISGVAILHDKENTLFKLTDSKLLTYIVTNGNDIEFELVNIDDPTKSDTFTFNLKNILDGFACDMYGITVIVSRKTKKGGKTYGSNYVWISIINFENNEKLIEGYLNNSNEIVQYQVGLIGDKSHSINSIKFVNQTLYRLKFYTKYQDFSEGVIPSNPIENLNKYKYNTAHITIRSVVDVNMLNEIKEQLHPNELVWVESSRRLNIKASNGEIYPVGAVINNENNEDYIMTVEEIAKSLISMGIVVDAEYNEKGEIISLNNIRLNDISDFTLVNAETDKRYTFTVDPNGNLVGKDMSDKTIEEILKDEYIDVSIYNKGVDNVRGFSADYFSRVCMGMTDNVPNKGDYKTNSDRVRISSFYAPLESDEIHGCSHSFIELENTSNYDFPLGGVYLHFYNPIGEYDERTDTYSGKVYHLALDGVIKAGSTYLIRGAKHIENDNDVNCFIRVNTFDKEWYSDGELVSFEQGVVKVDSSSETKKVHVDSIVQEAYRFCLTYGLENLKATDKLVKNSGGGKFDANGAQYDHKTFPSLLCPRFIDGCAVSSFDTLSKTPNDWFVNGDKGTGITITKNSMYRVMFALDPAKQAFTGFTTEDSSRIRYNKASDIFIVSLDKEYIGYPFSNETMPISRYTPKASWENKNVMTDKTQLDFEKPNMVTCSFGIDVYKTRCFNWISCGLFDEFVWIRKAGETKWKSFESYKTKFTDSAAVVSDIYRKEFNVVLNNAAYARITSRFPGNNVQFTSHKCIIEFKDYVETPTKYEYVVGRKDKDGNPEMGHSSDVQTFTLYPTSYEGRVYQITDQQGFHWIEYQVWAASAEHLEKQIKEECDEINNNASDNTRKVFPILINTGDMTQSGSRINEWLDYYNGGKTLFTHLEQMNCVGNNDLCGINPRDLGTGDDPDKSNSLFFHYCYCFEVDDNEDLVVKKHDGLDEDRFIPSMYYFKTQGMMYVVVNSEITSTTCENWYKLKSDNNKVMNIYTGIEISNNGKYDKETSNFTPIYETLYKWLSLSGEKKIVVAMHEMPFTVITRASLDCSKENYMKSTRNHPTEGARVGSNVNQLSSAENRGIYWLSRLLENFGCKLVIGGHKHTYALSYPIKEKYYWREKKNGEYDAYKDSISTEGTKPMTGTLEDESGVSPVYELKWMMDKQSDEVKSYYPEKDNNLYALNTTKTPYVPESLYNTFGSSVYSKTSGIFRCCTPIKTENDSFDGFVSYSMCQATGYKLKSNKELPWSSQVFSKIIPETIMQDGSDTPSGNQLYPMYSVLEIKHGESGIEGIDVSMRRITGIFATDGADKFTQTTYGKKSMGIENLLSSVDVDKLQVRDISIQPTDSDEIGKLVCDTNKKKIYECVETDAKRKVWEEFVINMYGFWTNKYSGEYLKIKY